MLFPTSYIHPELNPGITAVLLLDHFHFPVLQTVNPKTHLLSPNTPDPHEDERAGTGRAV